MSTPTKNLVAIGLALLGLLLTGTWIKAPDTLWVALIPAGAFAWALVATSRALR